MQQEKDDLHRDVLMANLEVERANSRTDLEGQKAAAELSCAHDDVTAVNAKMAVMATEAAQRKDHCDRLQNELDSVRSEVLASASDVRSCKMKSDDEIAKIKSEAARSLDQMKSKLQTLEHDLKKAYAEIEGRREVEASLRDDKRQLEVEMAALEEKVGGGILLRGEGESKLEIYETIKSFLLSAYYFSFLHRHLLLPCFTPPPQRPAWALFVLLVVSQQSSFFVS